MYCLNRSVIYFWMVFCASAAATHWQSENRSSLRSSVLMRCVAVLRNMEQMKHWPRRGGLGEKCLHWFAQHLHNSASQLCSLTSSYHVHSLEVQLNSKSVYGEVREKALQCFALGALLGKTQDQGQGESSLWFLKFGNNKQWSECLQMV